MNITYNEYNGPLFDGISAISPSNISQVLSYGLYGKVPDKSKKGAFNNGNNIEEALYTYINTKNLPLAVAKGINHSKKKQIIKLCHGVSKKFPNAELIHYQKILINNPYACISDFIINLNNKQYIIELKNNTVLKGYKEKLLNIIFDIQMYLLSTCSNLPVYLIGVTKDKIINKKGIYPKDYNLLNLINYLLYLNSLEIELNNKLELLKEYFKREKINYE